MRYLPITLLMFAVASIDFLPPLLGAGVMFSLPLTLVLTLEAI